MTHPENYWVLDPLQLNRISIVARDSRRNFQQLVELVGLNIDRDFVGADLDGVDFEDSNLDGFNFSNCSMRRCNFSRAKIFGATFDKADLMFSIISPSQSNFLEEASSHSDTFKIASEGEVNWDFIRSNIRYIIRKYRIGRNELADNSHVSYSTVVRFLDGRNIRVSSLKYLTAGIEIYLRDISADKDDIKTCETMTSFLDHKYGGSTIRISPSDQLELFSN